MSYQKPVTNLNEAFDLFLETEDWNAFYTHLIDFFAKPFTIKNEFWLNTAMVGDNQENLIQSVASEAYMIIVNENLLERYARKEIDNPYGYLKTVIFNKYAPKKWFEMKKRIDIILKSNPDTFLEYSRDSNGEPKYFLKRRQPESETGTGALVSKQIPVLIKNPGYIRGNELKKFIIDAMEQEGRPLSARELTNYLNKAGLLTKEIPLSSMHQEDPSEVNNMAENPEDGPEGQSLEVNDLDPDNAVLRNVTREFVSQLDIKHQRSLYFICRAAQGNSEERSEDLFKRATKMMGGKVTSQTIRNHIKQIDERFTKEMNPYIGENFEDLQRAKMLLCEEAIQILSRIFENGADE
ncbi:MAG: hypothetical protein Kow0037_30960 [Calditrichia bacterium]